MNEGPGQRRSPIDRATATRLGVAAGVFVILGAILGPTILTSPPPTPRPSGTAAAAVPTATRSTPPATPTSSPAATLEPWPDLLVPIYEPLAELLPTNGDRGRVATDTSFSLRSLTATPAADLARGLQIHPPVDLEITPGPTTDVVSVRPVEALTAGLRYRFRLDSPDGALAGTWAFVTRTPLHIVGTLPADQSVEVPTNTGIEITFDQDGATGVADRFSIEPAVAGRFEPHGRTWAFVPDRPLAEGTIYTVTVASGVGIAGSDDILRADVIVRFETAVAGRHVPRIAFERSILEVRPDTKPVVLVSVDNDREEDEIPESVDVRIHRLPNFAAVEAAATALAGRDGWAIASPSATVSTAGLTQVAAAAAMITSSDAGSALQLPVQLAAGNYIVTIEQPGAASQLLLQATNLSAYALTATATTIVWVNDLASDTSIAGATVSTADDRSLGATDARGVLSVNTPPELAGLDNPDSEMYRGASLLTVRAPDGRRLVVPIGLSVSWAYHESSFYGGTSGDWWQLLQTDRSAYRQTDTVHVYGTLRSRSDRSVPEDIEVRLRPADGPPEAPILRVPVTATERGVFTGDIVLDDLPRSTYIIDLFVAEERVSSLWIVVTEIRKPSYRIDVETDRQVYVVGDEVRVSTLTSFYDGTAVPDMELRFRGFEREATATTGSLGDARVVLRAASSLESPEGWSDETVGVAPARPEEGQISGDASVIVFPSRAWLRADGSVSSDRIVVTGTLTWADLARFEASLSAGGNTYELGDASGRPIAGGLVFAAVTHLIPERHQIGTTYDFIEKRVVPVYEYTVREVSLGSSTLTAGSDGAFRLSMPAPVPGDDYRITMRTVDPEGREFIHEVYASQQREDERVASPYLAVSGSPTEPFSGYYCGGVPDSVAGLDDPFAMTMHAGDGSVAAGGRFMFLVARLGSVEAAVLDGPTFSRTMRDADLPSFTIRAVWLGDDGYVVADAMARIDPDDKAITIGLQPDRASYRPGDAVTIAVTTTDPSGRPVMADVVMQGVDEKLYTLGLAMDVDPLGELMNTTSPGFLQSYRTHAVPRDDGGGCGAEGGSGDRDDFRDTVTFQRITKDGNGRGTIKFGLSDDLTSWHMTAVAVSGALDAGHASVLIPVGLPFFVDAIVAPEYLVGDLPVLRLRAYGGALVAGDRVRFVVESPSLGLAPTTVEAAAFAAIRVPLPRMTVGDHQIRIGATASLAGTTVRDSLVRAVRVVESRLGSLAASYDLLAPGYVPPGGDGLTTYVITDAGRGRLISLLEELASSTSARFDRSAAAELARALLIEEYGVPAAGLSPTGYDGARYQQQGIALLPYASADLFLSARAALVAGSKVNIEELRSAFYEWNDGEEVQRERRIVVLAGLAGIGNDVLAQLRAYDPATLTVHEQLWLGLGLVAAGDATAARAIERSLLESNGQRLGPWVRLVVGTTLDDTLEASGLLLLLAARLGDPLAHDVSRYLIDHPSREHIFPLEQIGYAQSMLEWLPRVPGRFAWTVGGERHEVDLEPGGAYSLVLTKSQRTSLAFERLEGELAVSSTWTAAGAVLPSDPTVSITRTVTPAGNAPDDRLVRVRFEIRFGPSAIAGCYRLTDLLPSGLAAVTAVPGWYEDRDVRLIYPYEGDGQRVSWCAYPSNRSAVYAYAARVVSPGTYVWEPAVVQSEVAPSVGSSTPVTTYVIR